MNPENESTLPETILPFRTVILPDDLNGSKLTSTTAAEQSKETTPSIEELQAMYDAKRRELAEWNEEVASLNRAREGILRAVGDWGKVAGVIEDRRFKIEDAREGSEQEAIDANRPQTLTAAAVTEIDPDLFPCSRTGLMSYLTKEIAGPEEAGVYPDGEANQRVLAQVQGWESDGFTPLSGQIATLRGQLDVEEGAADGESELRIIREERLRRFTKLQERTESSNKGSAGSLSDYVDAMIGENLDLTQMLFIEVCLAAGRRDLYKETPENIARWSEQYSEDTDNARVNPAVESIEGAPGEQ